MDEMSQQMHAELASMANFYPSFARSFFSLLDDLRARIEALEKNAIPAPVPGEPIEIVNKPIEIVNKPSEAEPEPAREPAPTGGVTVEELDGPMMGSPYIVTMEAPDISPLLRGEGQAPGPTNDDPLDYADELADAMESDADSPELEGLEEITGDELISAADIIRRYVVFKEMTGGNSND